MQIITLQRTLQALGYNPGPIDGALGPRTRQAIRAFQSEHGLTPDGIAGPATWAELARVTSTKLTTPRPPWIEEMLRRKGLHENRDHSDLLAWLRSAGSAVDPATTPWCGDAVETAILRALPDAAVPANPMASINWLKFGRRLGVPAEGAILVFWRGNPNGWQGHVGFYVGEDTTHYHVLGGNQSNAITVTRISKDRLRKDGIRWPNEYPLPKGGRILAQGDKLVETTNEA